jgi:hypothetical protein
MMRGAQQKAFVLSRFHAAHLRSFQQGRIRFELSHDGKDLFKINIECFGVLGELFA